MKLIIPPPLASFTSHLKSDQVLAELERRWSERQRFWHNTNHLHAMLAAIVSVNPEDQEILFLAALFHDAVYFPTSNDNETRSAELLLSQARDPNSEIVRKAAATILASTWKEPISDRLVGKFFELDAAPLSEHYPLHLRIAYEKAIFREYQFYPLSNYRRGRVEFLQGWAERFPEHKRGAVECMEILSAMEPKVAFYPGSFQPFHLGHLSTLRHAERTFDKVIVGVGVNRNKSQTGAEERAEVIRKQLRFHEVSPFGGLLSDHLEALEKEGCPVTVLRGVRDGTDLESELRYARFLNDLRAESPVVWIGCDPTLQHISSSAIRELNSFDEGEGERYVPLAGKIYNLVETA